MYLLELLYLYVITLAYPIINNILLLEILVQSTCNNLTTKIKSFVVT